MHRVHVKFGIALLGLLLVAAVGCARQSAQQEAETSSDSLLASNPVEQPEGDLTPQTQFEEQQTPAPTPTPTPKATPPPPRPRATTPTPTPKPAADPGVTLAAGTPIDISVSAQISSETAKVGDPWTGEVKDNVIVGDRVVIPAGSVVHGIVSAAKPAVKGDRAMLDLSVESVSVEGNSLPVKAGMEEIIAGSTRARNLGAIAGGAAAGALVGKAVGGSGKGALIGGLIGGAAAGAGVAGSKGYQVVLKEGTTLTFNVSEDVTVKKRS
jgi:hypothetical protein